MTNQCGRNALMIAASKGLNDVVKMLIDGNTKVDAIDQEGMTALLLPTLHGNVETVLTLIQANATLIV